MGFNLLTFQICIQKTYLFSKYTFSFKGNPMSQTILKSRAFPSK